ncbi:sensor histidine kinase [Actinophytocola sp. KF-1]
MRRRIVGVSLLVAVLAITLFGVPLAVGVAKYYLDDERAELERLADAVALATSTTLARGEVPSELPGAEEATSIALYGPDGTRWAGTGPLTLDTDTASADVADDVVSADTSSHLVVAVVVRDGARVLGTVRAATPRSEVWQRTVLTWAGMAVLGVAAVIATWLLARRQARRLAEPLEALSATANRLGSGDFTVRAARSGITEIDSVGGSLDTTAKRLADLLARERAFSAEASHQLRTPLAGLRLQLESALETPGADLAGAITAGLATTDRLERTIDDLLAFARDARPDEATATVGTLLTEIEHDWHGLLAEHGRALRVDVRSDVGRYAVAAAVLRQIVTVLLDNALRHGQGAVSVTARDAGDTVAVDVTDEGPGVEPDSNPFHAPGNAPPGHGLGLALARRLAEGEGGRLRLARPSPPTFTLLLPVREDR